jgi:osmoprotectant transport system substrate-binding protein
MPKQGAGWRRALLTVAAAAVVLAVLASCASAGVAATPPGRAPGTAVVVASFNFPESELLAAIYALALMHAGIPARLKLDLGPRELVQPALAEGVVDVVPEYLGTALTSLEPAAGVATSDPVAVRRELARALARRHVQVLQPAAAQDQDGLVVTRATAARLRLRTVSDLGPLTPKMVLGGAPECMQRPYCLPGLQRVYGLEFARFVALDTEQERIDAIGQGVVDVVVTGTTSGYLAKGGLVLLADDRQLQPADNIVPVVRAAAVARYGARLAGALDAVSARLTTNDLIFLNRRTTVAGKNVLAEARAWLERQGILPEPG